MYLKTLVSIGHGRSPYATSFILKSVGRDWLHLGEVFLGHKTHKLQSGSGVLLPCFPDADVHGRQVNFGVGLSGLTQLVRIYK